MTVPPASSLEHSPDNQNHECRPNWALDDLVNQLYAGQDPPGVEEALETMHRAHAAFYPPVIFIVGRVQVGTISNLDGIVPTVIEFVIHAHAPQSGMGRR